MILSIDPGDVQSAYVVIDRDLSIFSKEKINNEELLQYVYDGVFSNVDKLAIEMIASYGMAVGKTVFDTCVFIGRLREAFLIERNLEATYIYRKDEKMNLCGSMKAKDSNIRQALIDRFAQHDFKNGKGTKANKDWFYGFKADIWAAYAVAITYHDLYLSKEKEPTAK